MLSPKKIIRAAIDDVDRLRARLLALLDEIDDEPGKLSGTTFKREDSDRLTEAGREYLRRRFAEGASLSRIAIEMDISPSAVRYHVRKVFGDNRSSNIK